MDAKIWPLFELRIRTPRLELRPPTDPDVFALAELAAKGIHDPKEMPFRNPWTDAPSPELERNALQFHWRIRASWTPEAWHLPFAVWHDGQIVGQQDILATNFVRTRTFETGSWLGRDHQGQSIGKEMRTAVLHLGFLGLGADRAETAAYEHNPASIGVTTSLGYEPNGDSIVVTRDEAKTELDFKMSRLLFDRNRRDDITIEHLEPCLPMFGLDDR